MTNVRYTVCPESDIAQYDFLKHPARAIFKYICHICTREHVCKYYYKPESLSTEARWIGSERYACLITDETRTQNFELSKQLDVIADMIEVQQNSGSR